MVRARLMLAASIFSILLDAILFGVIFRGQELTFYNYLIIGIVTSLGVLVFARLIMGPDRP